MAPMPMTGATLATSTDDSEVNFRNYVKIDILPYLYDDVEYESHKIIASAAA
jgi:hypothetical protein